MRLAILNKTLALFLALGWNLSPALLAPSAVAAADTRILLITIDTLRPDRLSCYNKTYLQTPNVDKLAARGVVFERAFAHNPITLPSHANIMLGMTPITHGVHENAMAVVANEFLTIAEHLKSKGYATGAFVGAFPLDSRFGLAQGFNVYNDAGLSKPGTEYPYPERNAGKVIDAALAWLKTQDSKWFCWLHLWDPHAPYLPPEPFRGQFKDDPYSGEVAYVDTELGRLFDDLERSGQMKETLVVLTGDHGESLGEHGERTHSYFAYNSTLWVPLIISGQGVAPGRVGEYVCHVDILPTICGLLDIDAPPFLQGIPLEPLMTGKKAAERGIYFESLDAYFNRGWAPLRGIILDGGKYIESPIPEFYNLAEDFDEKVNLAQKADTAGWQKALKKIEAEFSYQGKNPASRQADRETQEKLASLGYVVSPIKMTKEKYGPEDDLKTLLPFEQKIDLSLALESSGKIAESVKVLTDLIGDRKDFVKAYGRLSDIYLSRGLKEDALNILEQGARTNPGNFSIVLAHGTLLVKQDRLDQGIEVLIRAIALYDQDPEAWLNLGIAQSKKGYYPKALESYQRALALDPKDAVILGNLGSLYFSMSLKDKNAKEADQAAESFKKAVEIDPGLASAFNGLGAASRVLGRTDEAIASWEKAIKLNPGYDLALYNLGVVYLEKGNKSRALECLEKYLALRGKNLSSQEQKNLQALIDKCREK